MYFDGMKNLKAEQLDQDFVITVINKANDRVSVIQKNLFEKGVKGAEEFSYNETQLILMCNMFNNLIDISGTISDLTDCITVGAVEHIQEELGLSNEEIADLDDDEIQECLSPYIATQHTFASFNNVEIRNMLYEIAKYILTDTEFIMLALGF